MFGRLFFGISLLLVMVGMAGCSSAGKTMGRYDIVIEVDKKIGETITVDVAAVPPSALPHWEQISVEKYFSQSMTGNEVRGEANDDGVLKSATFTKQDEVWKMEIKSTDPIWEKWEKQRTLGNAVPYMVITSNQSSTGGGKSDLRRVIEPLDICAWKVPATIGKSDLKVLTFKVQASGIVPMVTPDPEYKAWAAENGQPCPWNK